MGGMQMNFNPSCDEMKGIATLCHSREGGNLVIK